MYVRHSGEHLRRRRGRAAEYVREVASSAAGRARLLPLPVDTRQAELLRHRYRRYRYRELRDPAGDDGRRQRQQRRNSDDRRGQQHALRYRIATQRRPTDPTLARLSTHNSSGLSSGRMGYVSGAKGVLSRAVVQPAPSANSVSLSPGGSALSRLARGGLRVRPLANGRRDVELQAYLGGLLQVSFATIGEKRCSNRNSRKTAVARYRTVHLRAPTWTPD